jgi:hypothetical protein
LNTVAVLALLHGNFFRWLPDADWKKDREASALANGWICNTRCAKPLLVSLNSNGEVQIS